MHFNLNINTNIFLTVILSLTAVVGDFLVYKSQLHVFRAIFDNATHLIIGAISWFIVCINTKVKPLQTLIEVALCALNASLIDIDHFISARSFNLKNATNLKNRPFLHCTTVPLIVVLTLLLLSYIYNSNLLKKSSLIILTAFLSHHTRDATRRGFWLYPFNSTPAIPYVIYVILTCIIPYFIVFLDRYFIRENNPYKSVSVTVI